MADVITGNFAQVQAALTATAARVDAADEVVEEAGARIGAQIAEALSPKATGYLASKVDEDGGAVVADPGDMRAVAQEYGTRRHKAQPFMRPARERMQAPYRQTAERIYTVATR